MYGENSIIGRHVNHLKNLLASEAPEHVARRTWMAMFYADDELIVARLHQVVRLAPGIDPYESKLTVNVTRSFSKTPAASCYLSRQGFNSVQPEDVVVFLCLDRLVSMVDWHDITRYKDAEVDPMTAELEEKGYKP